MRKFTIGSVCSGIEAASYAWQDMNTEFKWFSEIANFPSKFLSARYPDIPNVGDMTEIPHKLQKYEIYSPDVICGGTPCQAFSFAGLQNGLNDDRGNLTLSFVDIIEANDKIRKEKNMDKTIVFWENVEGVLRDKTNAFGCLISSLAGLENILDPPQKKWATAGILKGPKRNIAWRVLDAKYFGVPQQRRRLYLLAGGKSFSPENILYELQSNKQMEYPIDNTLTFSIFENNFEIFRSYSDCLYSAYGTKWNGNAAAYNGSLFVVQNKRIRRLSPVECERLMGFEDDYTNINHATRTNRYQAVGNSWAVPVVRWIGNRIFCKDINQQIDLSNYVLDNYKYTYFDKSNKSILYNFTNNFIRINDDEYLNLSEQPQNVIFSTLKDIISADAPEDIYISPVACYGIVRRKIERNLKMNNRLETVLLDISSTMSMDDIEKRSRQQKRGRFSDMNPSQQISLFQ